jgi:hypothetical protein
MRVERLANGWFEVSIDSPRASVVASTEEIGIGIIRRMTTISRRVAESEETLLDPTWELDLRPPCDIREKEDLALRRLGPLLDPNEVYG